MEEADKAEECEGEAEEVTFSGWGDEGSDVHHPSAISVENDLGIAMRYLQQLGERNESVWFHLNELVGYVLEHQPKDCMRYFEELSRDLRMRKYVLEPDRFCLEMDRHPRLEEAQRLLRFYRKVECYYQKDQPFVDNSAADQNFLEDYALLREAGIGIQKSVLFNTYMGMHYLVKVEPILRLRFWGIIKGTQKNYFIAEARLLEDALLLRQKEFDRKMSETMRGRRSSEIPQIDYSLEAEEQEREDVGKENVSDEVDTINPPLRENKRLEYILPPVPEASPIVDLQPPYEPSGEGMNRYVYYVTNDPTTSWTPLPDVMPKHIVAARKIHKLLSGELEREVVSYPAFPGREAELLRAQIARISAGTHVSPVGFYAGSGEEEAAADFPEDGELFAKDPDYVRPSVKNLTDEGLEFWVHHEKYILTHGTTQPWRKPLDELGLEEEEMRPEELEIPPDLFRSLAEDQMEEKGTRPWRAQVCCDLLGESSAVACRSSLWPGAVAIAKDRRVLNVYCGWGTKQQFGGYRPPQPGRLQEEYPLGPEIMEMPDPTVEMEELEWQKKHPPLRPLTEHMGEELEDEERELLDLT